MIKKTIFGLFTAALMIASAATGTFRVSILQDSVVDGKTLKAGDYKLEIQNNMAVLKHGKDSIQLPAREETSASKFSQTEIQYTNNNDLQEIRIGGTNTKVVFTQDNTAGGGQ
jgi:hypothetical protein